MADLEDLTADQLQTELDEAVRQVAGLVVSDWSGLDEAERNGDREAWADALLLIQAQREHRRPDVEAALLRVERIRELLTVAEAEAITRSD